MKQKHARSPTGLFWEGRQDNYRLQTETSSYCQQLLGSLQGDGTGKVGERRVKKDRGRFFRTEILPPSYSPAADPPQPVPDSKAELYTRECRLFPCWTRRNVT